MSSGPEVIALEFGGTGKAGKSCYWFQEINIVTLYLVKKCIVQPSTVLLSDFINLFPLSPMLISLMFYNEIPLLLHDHSLPEHSLTVPILLDTRISLKWIKLVTAMEVQWLTVISRWWIW